MIEKDKDTIEKWILLVAVTVFGSIVSFTVFSILVIFISVLFGLI